MPNDNHIIIYKNGYSETENFNYWAYRQGRRLLQFKNKYEFIYYCLETEPDLVTKEMLSSDVMVRLIDLYNTSSLWKFLKVIPENEIPEFVKIYAASKDNGGSILSYLNNPSEDVINTALEIAGQNLVYIQKPTTKQILLGLSHETESPWLISKVKKPTVQMQITAVIHDFDAIKYIKNPCEAVKLAAAKAHGIEILRNINNPSEQVILTAINNSFSDTKRFFLYFIPHPNYKISCAINKQIKLTKQTLEKSKTETSTEETTLPTNNCSYEKLSPELEKLKRELYHHASIKDILR